MPHENLKGQHIGLYVFLKCPEFELECRNARITKWKKGSKMKIVLKEGKLFTIYNAKSSRVY